MRLIVLLAILALWVVAWRCINASVRWSRDLIDLCDVDPDEVHRRMRNPPLTVRVGSILLGVPR